MRRLASPLSRFAVAWAILVQPSIFAADAFSQSPSAPHIESVQEFTAKLTPLQKQQFDSALASYSSRNYADALAGLKVLILQLPNDPLLSKFASEAALYAGDQAFALKAIKPVAQAYPKDWHTAELLTWACAESGDKPCRDSGMAHMHELYTQGLTKQGVPNYIVEIIKVGDKTLGILASYEPWSKYNIYYSGEVLNDKRQTLYTITIETDDADQPFFADQHPKEAAAGIRQFSLDGYRDNGLNADGKKTQTHYTYKLFVGQPGYDTVREEFINVAMGKTNALTSKANIVK